MKRLLSMMLCLCMVLCFLPAAQAAEDITYSFDEETLTLTFSGTGEIPDYADPSQAPWSIYRDRAEELRIEAGITRIGENAFRDFTRLRNAYILRDEYGYTMESIGSGAFAGCESMRDMHIPGKVTQIGDGAFAGSGLMGITFLTGVETITAGAFRDCAKLMILKTSYTLSVIEENAFLNCPNLCHVQVVGPQQEIDMQKGNEVLETALWHKNINPFEDAMEQGMLFILTYGFDESCTHDYLLCYYCRDQYIPMEKETPEHVMGQWETVTYPSTTKEGQQVRECTQCAFEEYGPIEKLTQEPFSDIANDKFYYDALIWAVGNGITTGYKNGTFQPGKGCTRAEVVTFLWRAAGCPEPKSTNNPFEDVAEDAYYYKAVLWAVEKQITLGKTETRFAPKDTCTRAQIVTFLWRYNGRGISAILPEVPFSDVEIFDKYNAATYYGYAVVWAVEEGITTGYADGTFRPNNTCTRDQIVTFLYRYLVQ